MDWLLFVYFLEEKKHFDDWHAKLRVILDSENPKAKTDKNIKEIVEEEEEHDEKDKSEKHDLKISETLVIKVWACLQ